jgi:flagellar hook protein FlgE
VRTNTVQGDFQSASIGTFMADQRRWFFVVQKPSSFTDGRPTFDGSDLYTRRGDFQTDKDGFLVNGAGYYLMGIPVDAKTGNLAGSVAAAPEIPERLPAGAADHTGSVSRQPCRLSGDDLPTTPACPAPN